MRYVSDEHGKQFHQEIREIENRYQGKVNERMIANYCWLLQKESDTQHNHKSKRQKFFNAGYIVKQCFF